MHAGEMMMDTGSSWSTLNWFYLWWLVSFWKQVWRNMILFWITICIYPFCFTISALKLPLILANTHMNTFNNTSRRVILGNTHGYTHSRIQSFHSLWNTHICRSLSLLFTHLSCFLAYTCTHIFILVQLKCTVELAEVKLFLAYLPDTFRTKKKIQICNNMFNHHNYNLWTARYLYMWMATLMVGFLWVFYRPSMCGPEGIWLYVTNWFPSKLQKRKWKK